MSLEYNAYFFFILKLKAMNVFGNSRGHVIYKNYIILILLCKIYNII